MTCSFAKEFASSAYTGIENYFITEYLPMSSGDSVKVYLYGLFLCTHPEHDKSLNEIAQTLNMTEQTVLDCFKHWEEFGLLSILNENPLTVVYSPSRPSTGAKPKKIKAEKYTDFCKGLQSLIPSRMISTSEYSEYFNVMETYSIKPEAMLLIVKYCADKKGSDISYRYVIKVAKDFGNRAINTVEKVEKELSSYILRTGVLIQILNAMSIRRQPEIEDAQYLKKWTQELSFDAENIVFAASKLKKGSIAKLDEFLLELYSMKSFSKEEIANYLANKQAVYDLAIKINKSLSIYVDVLDTVVDTYTKKWLSYGFEEQSLLFIASTLFKSGKNTLRDMDELIETLRQRGFITLSGVGDYFESEKKTDEFIAKMLMTVGLNRRPNSWDRENVNMWKSWNFSEDMILQAAKVSAGKSIAYMNGVLSNWKNNGVFSVESAVESLSNKDDTQETYNREYERRRTVALSRAQKNNDIAFAIEGFPEIYGRLNGMEKDLAFAEIAQDQVALKKLEKEKQDLTENAEQLLSTVNLTLRDLSPRYACEKCNDTGYVGTHRCDCFDKK
ncbi:MAG: DnaD domain protein [Clostridia bacterium]|nr:DnaD domain protein [Clostridia bacterium]